MATLTYRMTPDEYARYLVERDVLARESQKAEIRGMVRVREANGAFVIDGTHASAAYDRGENFYWVRTARPVDWM